MRKETVLISYNGSVFYTIHRTPPPMCPDIRNNSRTIPQNNPNTGICKNKQRISLQKINNQKKKDIFVGNKHNN